MPLDWPVEWVALYDPAAFGDTRQFDAADLYGTPQAPRITWHDSASCGTIFYFRLRQA